jgi:hypothetical protein
MGSSKLPALPAGNGRCSWIRTEQRLAPDFSRATAVGLAQRAIDKALKEANSAREV